MAGRRAAEPDPCVWVALTVTKPTSVTNPSRERVLFGRLLPPSGVYVFDPVHTFVEFSVQHMVVGRVVGHFAETTGTITLAEDPRHASLEVTVATNGVNTHNAMRDEDLRSARFFDVAAYPAMTYRGGEIIADIAGRWVVNGKLTVRDVTLPTPLVARVSGTMEDERGNVRFGIQATATASRREFGLLTDLERETGGLMLRNDVVITVSSEALLQH
jgi:polyisoprenoid-binding protein YceI